jgi:hypothetical protein
VTLAVQLEARVDAEAVAEATTAVVHADVEILQMMTGEMGITTEVEAVCAHALGLQIDTIVHVVTAEIEMIAKAARLEIETIAEEVATMIADAVEALRAASLPHSSPRMSVIAEPSLCSSLQLV